MTTIRSMNVYDKVQFARVIAESDYYPHVDRTDFEEVTCYGAYDDDGGLIAGVMLLMQGNHAYLDYLYVLPEYRNLGYGVKLLDAVRIVLAQHRIKYVYASINGANEVSGKLAARHRGKVGFPYMHVRIDLEEKHG